MNDFLIKIVLWATIENYVGLWEITWEINSVVEKNDEQTNKKIAKEILLYLLNRDFIRLYYSEKDKYDYKELNKGEATDIIVNEKYWNTTEFDNIFVMVASTKEGEAFYNSLLHIHRKEGNWLTRFMKKIGLKS